MPKIGSNASAVFVFAQQSQPTSEGEYEIWQRSSNAACFVTSSPYSHIFGNSAHGQKANYYGRSNTKLTMRKPNGIFFYCSHRWKSIINLSCNVGFAPEVFSRPRKRPEESHYSSIPGTSYSSIFGRSAVNADERSKTLSGYHHVLYNTLDGVLWRRTSKVKH